MKKFLVCLVGLSMATGAYATTKTVGKSGAQFTSIQAAIDSFTQAELSDGQADVVEIQDAAEYDEQVMIGSLVPNPEEGATPEGYLDEVITQVKARDPFTLRGKDANTRPKINPVSGEATRYGVFTGNPGDSFVAAFTYFGKNITIENVEILQSSELDADQYGINGQAGNMTFRNVLFAHDGETAPGEALVNLNNDVSLVEHGIDNSYTFVDCTFQGSLGDARADMDSIYFHGYSADDITAAGTTPEQATARLTFQGCDFLNNETAMIVRGNAQANEITVDGCYFTNTAHGIRGSGKGTVTVTDSIFYKNAAQTGEAGNDWGSIETVGRGGFTPALNVQNNLFADNLNATDFQNTVGADTRAATIRIQNDGTEATSNPDLTFNQNTFVNCPVVFRFSDASGREREATVNNNIFKNVGIILTVADGPTTLSYLDADNVDANGASTTLVVNGVQNVFDNVATVVEDTQLLPNVKIGGTIGTVTFANTTINASDPFAGPPYDVTAGAGAGVGADLSQGTDVAEFMLY